MNQPQRYPLEWPVGWKRTAPGQRRAAKFHATRTSYQGEHAYRRAESLSVGDAVRRLASELRRLGVVEGDWLLSSNLRMRLDGLPYAEQRNPDDPGASVYFRLDRKNRVLACDVWTRVADNIAAVAAHIECLRGIDRYGVGTMEQAFAGYKALPADTAANWRSVFGFSDDDRVTLEQLTSRYHDRARAAHPDAGGSHDAMAHLNRARDFARAELS